MLFQFPEDFSDEVHCGYFGTLKWSKQLGFSRVMLAVLSTIDYYEILLLQSWTSVHKYYWFSDHLAFHSHLNLTLFKCVATTILSWFLKKMYLILRTQFYPTLGVFSNITPVLLPVWHTKVSMYWLSWLSFPKFVFDLFFSLYIHFSLHSSAQREGWSGCPALYFCFNWPGRKPTVWLLSSHQQHEHLPLHTQVRFVS